MNTKLTLSLDKMVIEEAKNYAKEKGISLSKMVENLLRLNIRKKSKTSNDIEIPPAIKDLAISSVPMTKEKFREEYTEYLEKKYR